ncbi:Uncharacterized protein HZ326_26728 [Fusarium oxysporum f. sp. albedinis]|nr:Uncharacterized protein HZ326_26728 [Fusarium oxysporum f. sp. albedinis]
MRQSETQKLVSSTSLHKQLVLPLSSAIISPRFYGMRLLPTTENSIIFWCRLGVSLELLQAKPNRDVSHVLECGKWRHTPMSLLQVEAAFAL